MNIEECVRSEEEQLYMLEILVKGLSLCPDKIEDPNTNTLCVRIKFIDIPTFEIGPEELTMVRKTCERIPEEVLEVESKVGDRSVKLNAGKSCLFAKPPCELVRAMHSRPLKVGVYKIAARAVCGVVGEPFPICEARVPLSGCLCDQVSTTSNERSHPPKAYTLTNVYDLIDDQNKISGSIALSLRLSCFGKSIVTHFAFQEKFSAPRSSQMNDALQPVKDNENRDASEIKMGNLQSVQESGETTESSRLPREARRGDETAGNVGASLCVPTSPPKISMGEPGFEKLTNAEKLNDRQYRGHVYRAYPNEPTCACTPVDNHPIFSSTSSACPSGCLGRCCSSMRQPSLALQRDNANNDKVPCFIPSYCVRNPQTSIIYDSGTSCTSRMRGGGCGLGNPEITGFRQESICHNEQYPQPVTNQRIETTTNYSQFQPRRELHSTEYPVTNDFEEFNNHRSVTQTGFESTPVRHIDDHLASSNEVTFDAYKPQSTSNPKSGCGCPAKEALDASLRRRGVSATIKKPCIGVDCLIRAFKNAQDFVDSLGTVPGLAGLGLMSPSESPYFGRDKEQNQTMDMSASKKGLLPPQQMQYSGPCNTLNTRQGIVGVNSVMASFPSATPFTIAVPGRSGVVREAIPVIPEAGSIVFTKQKRKDEKLDKQKELETIFPPPETELGPCGEPRCRSRKRTRTLDSSMLEATTTIVKKTTSQTAQSAGAGTAKLIGKVNTKQHKNKTRYPGPGGDRNATGKSHMKVGRRIMKFVYAVAATYPGINYGHKNCIDPRPRVPGNMGWLWNTNTMMGRLKPRKGWKPGAIAHSVNEILKEAKVGVVHMPRSRSRAAVSKSRKRKMQKSKSFLSKKSVPKKKDGEEEDVEPPPTLHIHRKDGTYYVTMYPIKQESMEVPQLEEPMKPLQFKIPKNKDDASVASSSSASDMEIEFSPPAAVNRYRKKPNVIHVDTQVKQQEILDAFKPPDSAKKKEKKSKKGKK
ncbi:uncharacterized protein LOC107264888 [Cephus cinctus]|uniref:Uncharacterized protein LOC107264888 n=1 Tax=Cephus cinctus TaxID=211228 RepID=A0AAJ7BLL4_CEPCN|nr:uncharacterized protein LOC107264888 [Cephus cinctus]